MGLRHRGAADLILGQAPQIDYVEAILRGGAIAYIILLLSIVLVTVSLVLLVTIRRGVHCPEELSLEIASLLEAKQREQGLRLLESDPSVLARILEAGIIRSGQPAAVIRQAMQEASAQAGLRLHQRVGYVGLIAAVAPMLGLLGTVAGMIEAFATLSENAAAPQASLLAASISKALITTYLGLTVAIPALIVHMALRNRVNNIILRAAELGERLVGLLAGGQAGTDR